MTAASRAVDAADRDLSFLEAGAVSVRARHVTSTIRDASLKGDIAIIGSAALPRKCAQGLQRAGGSVACFIEYDPRCWGRVVDGTPVLAPDEAARRLSRDAVIIVGIWSPNHKYAESQRWMRDFGFRNIYPVHAVFWLLPELEPHYQLAPPDVFIRGRERAARVMQGLADEVSRRQLAGHLRWRATLEADAIPPPDRKGTYFDRALMDLGAFANIVDCGAFDGDSLRQFLYWHGSAFERYLALEPDPISFGKLNAFICSLPPALRSRIEALQVASGMTRSIINVSSTGMPGSQQLAAATSVEVPCIPIDELLGGLSCHYLKLDIEGAEWDALAGARSTIAQKRPVIGTAIYHKPDDIFELPLALMGQTPDYTYHVRTHDDDGIDVVFYAVPRERRSRV